MMLNQYKILSIIITIFLLPRLSQSQTYVPITVSGFNHDLIANGSGGNNRAAATTTTTFDNENIGGYNVMYSTDFRGNDNPNTPPPFGLPINRIINSVNLPGASYELAPYDLNNVLVLKTLGSSGTLTLETPGVFSRIAILGSSAEGLSSFDVILNFSDGTNTTTSFNVADWFFGSDFAVKGIGRVTRSQVGSQGPDEFSGDSENPRLYDNQIILSPPNTSKILTSITFEKLSTTGNTAILAINGITAVNAPVAPIATQATNISPTGFTANWLSTQTATNYFIDVSESPTFGTLVPDYNNRSVGNVLFFNIDGLPNSALYYYRIRASNISGISPSSNTIEVCLTPQPSAVCSNIAVQLNNTGNYTLTSADISAIGDGSVDNCSSQGELTLSVNPSVFNCDDLILGQPNNYAVELDGINDFIQSQASNVLKVLPLTVEAWVKPELRTEVATFYPNNVLSNDRPSNFGHGFGANVNNSVNQITVEYQNGFREINNAGLSTNTWQHIAVVYTSGNVKTYLNGALIDDFNYVQRDLTGTGSFWIGKHNDDGTYGTRRFYKGQVDEVRVWHRALTVTEILESMNTTSVGEENDLQLYYTFEDGPGSSTVTDILGNSNADFQADMDPNTDWVNPGAPVVPAVLGKSVILTMMNEAGISATCTAMVTINDNIPPIAICPTTAPIVVIDNTGNGTLIANALAGGNSMDNCPNGLVETSTVTNFSCMDAPTAMVVLTATDGAGNINTTVCLVNIDDSIKPIANINSGGITVLEDVNSSITLDATGSSGAGFDTLLFQWSTGEFGPIIEVSQAGIYSVTVTNPLNGCSDISSIEIFDAKCKAVISGNEILTCTLDKVTLFASDALGANPAALTYIWSTGSTLSSIEISSPGIYWVNINLTDGTCSDTAFVEIIENRIKPEAIIISDSGLVLNCFVSSITLDARFSNSQDTKAYSWSNGATTSDINVTTGNIYSVTVTDSANGCTDASTIEVRDENIDIKLTSNTPVCSGNNLNLFLENEGDSYLWAGPGGFNSQLKNPTLVNVSQTASGIYFGTVTLSNGCVYSASLMVVVNKTPDVALIVDDTICAGSNILINETGNDAVMWMWTGPGGLTGTNNPFIIPNIGLADSGLYTVNVSDVNGCVATASLPVLVNPVPKIEIVEEGSLCTGSILIITEKAGDATTWQWTGPDNFSASGNSISLTGGEAAPGLYLLTAMNEAGCSSSTSYDVKATGGEQIETNFLVSEVACVGDTLRFIDYSKITIEDGVTFAWDFGNGDTSTERDPLYKYSETGTFDVSLTLGNSECAGIKIKKTVEILNCRIGFSENQFSKIYPTPNNGSFNIDVKLPEIGPVNINIYNADGKIIQQHYIDNKQNVSEDIFIENPGLYYIEIRHNYGLEYLKTIVIK